MSAVVTCDFCGHLIEGDRSDEDGLVEVRALGHGLSYRPRGHYHRRDCWPAVLEVIEAVHSASVGLAAIQTVSTDELAARRREHTGGQG